VSLEDLVLAYLSVGAEARTETMGELAAK
jgi:hypothetical protein